MKIVNLILHGAYTEGFAYQENCLPLYQKKLFNAEVTVICGQWSLKEGSNEVQIVSSGTYIDKNGIKVIRNKSWNGKIGQKFAVINNLYNTLENENPDYIFVHLIQSLSLSVIKKYKIKHPNVIVYADSHSDYVNSAHNFISYYFLHKIIWKCTIKKNLPYINKIYGVLPARVEFLKKMYGINENKLDLLVMGAEDELVDYDNHELIRANIRNKYCLKDELLFITGGKIDKKKNVHLLIEAFKKNDSMPIKLLIFGSYDNELRDYFLDINDIPNIIYVGWQSPADIYKLYHAADISIFPGTHSVLWEQAIGAGLPGIYKRWKGIEHVDVNGNIIFLESDSAAEIESSIMRVTNDKKLLESLKERAEQARNQFLYSNIALKSLGGGKSD